MMNGNRKILRVVMTMRFGYPYFWIWFFLSFCLTSVVAQTSFLEQEGIDARRLQQAPYLLTGSKIAIGQVEVGRAGKFGFDKIAAWQPPFSLAGIFVRDRLAEPNRYLDNHAAMVAGILVSRDKRFPGVAPGARLYAGAIGSLAENGQPEECLTSQMIAQQNGNDVRAINFSFGESLNRDPRPEASLDGQALLSQCIDWLARSQNVLFVVAGNQGKGGIPIPTDHYNGLTVAYSTKRQEKFDKVDFANLSRSPQGIGRRIIEQEMNTGSRSGVTLVAPGSQIKTYDLAGKLHTVTGTSFAAPQVTGTIALLQEFGDRQLSRYSAHWSLASRRHEVMKAILLNSADKLQDSGDGSLLGMTRTILTQKNQIWRQSTAFHNPQIPLDPSMGAGQLNAFRAYQQFQAGQWTNQQPIPPLGWNYGHLTPQTFQDYILANPLAQHSFVAITLVWDRWVELQDQNQNKSYDLGENFRDLGLNNLDLYLLPVDPQTEISDHSLNLCSSQSLVDSVEHIFCQVPQTGQYKIRVRSRSGRARSRSTPYPVAQPYALSWWTATPNIQSIP